MPIAPHVAAWGSRWPRQSVGPLGLQSGVPPVTFPTTPLRIRVELLLYPALGMWVDISSYVMYDQKIVITRGRRNEQSTAGPSTCQLRLRNSDRRFSPRNPALSPRRLPCSPASWGWSATRRPSGACWRA